MSSSLKPRQRSSANAGASATKPPAATPLAGVVAPLAGLAVRYMPLLALTPYARNARVHTPQQIIKVKASLLKFGWTNPMLIAEGGMLAGHARLRSAIELANEGQAIPRNDDPWQGPTIDLSHLTPIERRTYILTDNRLAEEATWDRELLSLEFVDIGREGVSELEFSGFDPSEIATISHGWQPDWDKIARTEAEMSAMLDVIRVHCPKEHTERALDLIRVALAGIEGIRIDP